MERVDERLKNHEDRLDKLSDKMEDLKRGQSDLIRTFEKFQLKSDLLQQRSNEMFAEIKQGLKETKNLITDFQTEQNDEHYKRPKKRNEDITKAVTISILSALVGLLFGILANI